ncbi:MAG: hypothetical protein B0W54_18050 [Cellvibrio sp. 79]|nr:MAG: hypothetical protein B0W54_18050 [Cellvibrio sp. 79]
MDINRWQHLMLALGIGGNPETYLQLIAAYSESHRHYHTGAHVDACLKHLDQVRLLANHSAEIEIALWFHDAIYKPRSSSNELDSANWCCSFLMANEVDAEVIARVHQLIMATCHNVASSSNDEQLLVDVDLAILGAPENIYWQFEDNVRKEYKWVPGFIFRAKRKEILDGFLQRERIYNSDYFFQTLEQQARINLRAAIARL